MRPGVPKVESKFYLEHAKTKSVDSYRRVVHDSVRTGFVVKDALKEKSNAGNFRMCSFPNMLELKSSCSPSAGEGTLCKASPNRSVVFEEKLYNDAGGDASCVEGEGNGGGVTTPEELLDAELALENRRFCEELSDPNEDEREEDDGDGEAIDASEAAGVTPLWETGLP